MRPDRAEGNRFIAAWPDVVFRRLAPRLKPVMLRHGMVLANGGPAVEHVYFPDRGMISLVKTMHDGRTVEVGIVGAEGMAGIGAVLGMRVSSLEAMVQVDGYGQRLETAALQAEIDKSHALKALTMRYLAYRVTQLAQTAACNRLHTLRQRCCRWLLTADDNVQATTFTLTHEFLALMMGVNRPSVSLVAAGLQRRGMIRYRRAAITIIDRPALERAACECYVSLKQEADRVYQP
ncbi:MAG: Crp/Fnr family transcriptional regulator [Alphaproteobacteria bacterium]|nr:Crp/Fnr family transcriptional regulator [Alphaproteobacteria bacterium]